MKLILKTLPIALGALALTGCVNLAPEFERPESPVAQAWPTGEAYANEIERVKALPAWREYYRDPRLVDVIAKALENNRDARIARLNVEKLEALYGVARSQRVPNLSASVSEDARRSSAKMSPDNEGHVSHAYTSQLAALAFEVDFFSRVRNLSEAALRQYLSGRAQQTVFENSLIAQVAMTWMKIGADRELLDAQKVLLKSQEDNLEMVRKSYEAGATTELAYRQAASLLESLKADVQASTRTLAADRNTLDYLAGASVDEELFPEKLSADVVSDPVMLEGAPSEVLLGRPDIHSAENVLRAADANIGAARAAFFPRVTLMAGVGTMSSEMSGLFDARTGVWSFTPSVSLPIFTGGMNLANLRAAEKDKQIAVAKYEQAVQAAFRETADAMSTYSTAKTELDARESMRETDKRAYDLAELLYEQGAQSYTDVLTSRSSYVRSVQQAIGARLNMLGAYVNLYKALGGGVGENGDGH